MNPLPSLQQLRFLSALAEHRHFGQAAAACSVTQSTLSAGLRELEDRLAVSLVERDRRNVLLTPLGEEIVERGRKLLRDAEELRDLARSSREPLSGPLRLGVIPTISEYFIPAAARGLAAFFPKLKLYLREEQSAVLLERLAKGELDLLLIALPYDTGDLDMTMIGQDRILAAIPAGHPMAQARQIEQEDLIREPLLLLEDGHCLRSHALMACRLSKAGDNELFQGTSLRTLLQMVAAGIGVTLLPEMAVPMDITPDSGLVARRIAGDPSRSIALAWRQGSARKAEFRSFGQYLKSMFEQAQGRAGRKELDNSRFGKGTNGPGAS